MTILRGFVPMFDWQKILSEDNYHDDPIPHWRAYDVLPESDYQALLESYDDVCLNQTCQGVFIPDTPDLPDEWQRFADHNFKLGGEPARAMQHKFGDVTDDWFISAHAMSRHQHQPSEIAPGELIRDWHIDGDSKYFNTIYYLGPETQGHIELRNELTGKEKSYAYAGNSILVWRNITPEGHHYHQFRNSDSGIRRTVYLCWAPLNSHYIENSIYCIDPGTAHCLETLTDYQGLTT